MIRYPRSGDGFLSDLLAPTPPELSPVQVETVCRILLDMPDLGTWHRSALQILPRYRATTDRLLAQDKQASDTEKSYRAQVWQAELSGGTPGFRSQASLPHRGATTTPSAPPDTNGPLLFPPPSAPSHSPAEQRSETVAVSRPPAPAPSLATNSVPQSPPAPDSPRRAPLPSAPAAYQGARSGTLECTGAPVPQNAEYVFRNLPPVPIELDYDKKVWDARLAPAENQTQKLIMKNKSSGPQKKCLVHWSAVP
jgi:hypothetical protein